MIERHVEREFAHAESQLRHARTCYRDGHYKESLKALRQASEAIHEAYEWVKEQVD